MIKALFVNHIEPRCGVFQMGDLIGRALVKYSRIVNWAYLKTILQDDYWRVVDNYKPDVVVFNYHPHTSNLPFEVVAVTKCITLGIVHETSWLETDEFLNEFDYLIASGWTAEHDRLFSTTRTIPSYRSTISKPTQLTVGSFGFAMGGKGFEQIIELVQNEFDEAIIRFHMPRARFGDNDGVNTKRTVELCKQKLNKPNITLEINYDFIDQPNDLIDWLAGNTINCFLYDASHGRGISSSLDFALAARRPIAISNSEMFRHIPASVPIRVEHTSLSQIIENKTTPLIPFYKQWTEPNTAYQYGGIIEQVLS